MTCLVCHDEHPSWWLCPAAQRDHYAFTRLAASQWARMDRDPDAAKIVPTRGIAGSTAMSRGPRYPAANASGEVAA